MAFLPAERFILTILATLISLDALLLWWKDVGLDVPGYAALSACGVFLILLGQFYRRFRPNERIAVTATAAGLFVLFTIAGSIFNYLLLPIYFTPIDRTLIRLDGMLGYTWPDIVSWAAGRPVVGTALRIVYMSSLLQLLVVIVVLGFTDKTRTLHHFLLTGVMGALLAMIAWFFAPSIGPSAFYQIPQNVVDGMPLAVDNHYGAELSRALREGAVYLTPKNVLGLIAFPSFHMVMACMSVCFLARVRFLSVPACLLNAAMMPAILIHGGHHLIDLIGGAVTFAAAYGLSARLLKDVDRREAGRKAKLA
ncbi:phosphatase PAP2 family protein [Rhizobium sp. S152]|uniref:phosphatase PAP2 family protein n=1 Tax=Rhizobium sp. S152 TaxID=3055038 RepID=UPI0025A94E1F|nr:phosphatase PAP2 family protein [Rhizobium sp. S152]MDM9629698.1 phosphatase PAP2 family protein [Rhizobium sp. S152]